MNATQRASVLVTGDAIIDHNLYMGSRTQHNSKESLGSYSGTGVGGAYLLYRLVQNVSTEHAAQMLKKEKQKEKQKQQSEDAGRAPSGDNCEPQEIEPTFDVHYGLSIFSAEALGKHPHLHGYAIWKPFAAGGGEKGQVWRVEKPLGYGHRPDPLPPFPAGTKQNGRLVPDVLALDDAGLGFRFDTARSEWPECITDDKLKTPQWVVLKLSAPLGYGNLLKSVQTRFKDRLILVASVDDVRREDATVSLGVSWERSALDLMNALERRKSLADLKANCRYLVVSYKSAGALVVSNDPRRGEASYRLIYDPMSMEGEWEANYDGSIFGFTSSLGAGIITELINLPGDAEDRSPDLDRAVSAGLSAMRRMLVVGHGRASTEPPDYQYPTIAQEILNPSMTYSTVDLPARGSRLAAAESGWTIIASDDVLHGRTAPLYGTATGVALMGDKALAHVPHLQLKKFRTVDRSEIESLRNIRQVVTDYLEHDEGETPLSIAVFGPPGSGKSFVVKQIAKAISKDEATILEFNLSQFAEPRDLIGAFHQIRDAVLSGDPPFVFWDEFDSKDYYWLQYLLAPMQDGTFQDGQLNHPIGKCVFIFAGGTAYEMDDFGKPSPPPPDEEEPAEGFSPDESGQIGQTGSLPSAEEKERARRAHERFKQCKGPDFRSRLTTYLNVSGPNRRRTYNRTEGRWENDASDVCFPIRRALFVRSVLGFGGQEPMDIDRGVLAALLRVPRYEHGSRSLQKILAQWKQRCPDGLHRSFLPPEEVLQMHVSYKRFMELIDRYQQFEADVDELAPVIHEYWWKLGKAKGWERDPEVDKPYAELKPEYKGDNRAAAARIPLVLELAGLYVVKRDPAAKDDPAETTDVRGVLARHLELLAEAEHDGWMEHKELNGWSLGPRDNRAKRHPALKPYRELSHTDREKDRNTIRHYPDILDKANYRIVFDPA